MSTRDAVLLSWLAYNHDPFERDKEGRYRKRSDGSHIWGPTLTFLFDPDSPFRGKVGQVRMLVRRDPVSVERAQQTFREIRRRDDGIQCELLQWRGEDPTDHRTIFGFLRRELPAIRRQHSDQQLLIHASPGTPSMATIWVLMAETGFIREPFQLLKSLRPHERKGRSAVEPIRLDLDTFYKRYRESRPQRVATEEQGLFWDPAEFRSPLLRDLYEQARRAARLPVPVLILGERGTGKTTLASWIRLHSPFHRKELDTDWPSLACGQYQPATMRAELFGYKKGAFTGANEDRDGLLARAHRDTLFLDEVGDLTRDVQRLLIRAIEEGRFLPLGSTKTVESRFRLITATNIPLDELRQRLDADFFDRIATLRLRVPSLREFRHDLPWLWHDVLSRVQQQAGFGLELRAPHHERVLRFLAGQPLPGNVRDLFALAWRAMARWSEQAIPEEELAQWLPTALDAAGGAVTGDLARDVAGRFANGEALDDLIGDEPLPTKDVLRALQIWMAEEVGRIARQRGVAQDKLVDVTAKTLRQWRRSDG